MEIPKDTDKEEATMKDCLLIANSNAVTYKEVFPLIKEGKLRAGYHTIGSDMFFHITDEYKAEIIKEKKEGSGWKEVDGEICGRIANACWFVTLPTPGKKTLTLTKTFNPEEYPHYDNYNAIEVSRIKNIPYDYEGVMGVPITILGYDLENVEIYECLNDNTPETRTATIEGKEKYCRVLIKKKIVIMGDKTINGKDTYLNGKEKYRRVPIRLTRWKQL